VRGTAFVDIQGAVFAVTDGAEGEVFNSEIDDSDSIPSQSGWIGILAQNGADLVVRNTNILRSNEMLSAISVDRSTATVTRVNLEGLEGEGNVSQL